eukprot:CAMPEP_0182486840 /NCGR_PEP_ID=MMETSP1319-20130603/47598_1 /TAXON_ID=172717 /ORGANISM="Bolidomonas pacifica, Strain RCC208" /LENGTH=174 /DNA_ID=CAMNT_0024688947 /DNA_START=176 /DNA_END=700 /DNA_ORIENTATION=+
MLRLSLLRLSPLASLPLAAGVARGGTGTVGECEGKKGDDDDLQRQLSSLFSTLLTSADSHLSSLGSGLTTLSDTGVPSQLSFGFTSGFCSGYALKKAGRFAAAALGVCYVGLQALQYKGYAQVDYKKLERTIREKATERGGAEGVKGKVFEVLEYGGPGGGGFGAGFLMGVRKG